MATIKITCDSASDLPRELSGRYRIDVLPLGVKLGNELRHDRVDIESREVYDYTEKTGQLPAICAVSVEDYRKCFETYTLQGQEVIHISLSSEISHCYENACQAAKLVGHVHVVDSQSVSTGAGQLALLATELAGADYRPEEIEEALNDMKKHLDVSFVLQTADYFRKRHTIGSLAAFGAQKLGLKPEIELNRGSIHPGKPFRGDMESTILSYVRSRLSGKKNVQTDRIFITYSAVPRAILDKVNTLLRQLQPFEQILEVPASSVVSSRCGPGCLGLSFMTC